MNIIDRWFPNVVDNWDQFTQSTIETIQMVFITAVIAGILGLMLGILLVVTQEHGILENKPLYYILDKAVNVLRSIPFIILLALVVPLTRILVGTSIGTTAAIVPLTIGAFPFYARQVQNALVEVSPGIVEAAKSVGSGPLEIIIRVYLKEGLVDLIRVSVVTLISVIDLTAMAGAIGGGGLGNLAITFGYNRFQTDIVVVATLIILVLVFITQAIGDFFIRRLKH